MDKHKFAEILFIITCLVVITCGGFYLQSKLAGCSTGTRCECIKK